MLCETTWVTGQDAVQEVNSLFFFAAVKLQCLSSNSRILLLLQQGLDVNDLCFTPAMRIIILETHL